jgi:signal transduction histidine kinase
VGNAVKFTPAGGRITVAARRISHGGFPSADSSSCGLDSPPHAAAPPPAAGDFVEIAVEDTGEGIPAEELDAIFDKFHQVRRHGRGKAPGTGLGLAISKSLVELMGGRIRVESRVGAGSRFSFTLPAADAPAAAPGQRSV